jgi:hypothetical protein
LGALEQLISKRRWNPAGALRSDRRRARIALEYNVVRWGKTELPPQAGLAVYVQRQSGKLVAACIYDDIEPPPPRMPKAST